MSNEIVSEIKSFPSNKIQEQKAPGYQTFKEKLVQVILKLFKIIKETGSLPNSTRSKFP
jgi:hypothetical protein